MEAKFRGCLIAGACGDALGAPVEFSSISRIKSQYGDKGITELELNGDISEVTDDTQMDIYTAQGIIHAFEKKRDYNGILDEIYKCYYFWYCGQAQIIPDPKEGVDDLTINGKNPELKVNRCPGCTCLSALASRKMGTRTTRLNNSKGCGGIMRAAPAGLIFFKEPPKAYELGCDLAAMTHGHPLGYQSSGALAMIIAYIIEGKTIEQAVNQTIEDLEKKPECAELVIIMKNAVITASKGPNYADAFIELGEGWVGEEALAIAIWASLVYPNDLKQAIIAAVNHSGDSDSTGAICGYIVGASLSEEAIPVTWRDHVELKNLLVTQADQLYSLAI